MRSQHDDDRHNGGMKTKGRDREIFAYFPNKEKAQQAAKKVAPDVDSTQVNQVSREQAKQGLHGAQSEVSVVEIGQYAWIGLATGVVSGLILGLLAFSGRVPLPGIAQTLSASSSAVFFLWAGIVGCIGWLIGALIPLLKASSPASNHELSAIVTEDTLVNVERMLARAGASTIIVVKENG